jgi:hypothetical protein
VAAEHNSCTAQHNTTHGNQRFNCKSRFLMLVNIQPVTKHTQHSRDGHRPTGYSEPQQGRTPTDRVQRTTAGTDTDRQGTANHSYHTGKMKSKVKQSLYTPDRPRGFREVEASRFHDSGHINVVRLTALRTDRLDPPPSPHVDRRAIVRPEGLCQREIPLTPSRIEPATPRLVAQCLDQCATSSVPR